MTIKRFILCIVLCCVTCICTGQNQQKLVLDSLPPIIGSDLDVGNGFAGMMGGEQEGVLIAAGGANFPNGLPWEGGSKVWSDAIYYLDGGQWNRATTKLPKPLAYGASVVLPEGIL